MDGKTFVVTGGSRGIGRAVVELLTKRGAKVALLARRPELLDDFVEATGAVPFQADVSDEVSVVAAFAKIDDELGDLDGLFANAGIALDEGPVHNLSSDRWDLVLSTNLTGSFIPVRETLKRLVAGHRGGSIVCTSSCVVGAAVPGAGTAYHASKGGIEALVRSVAVEYGGHGIRCNALSPGATETELMWAAVPEDEIPEARKEIAATVALGRVANPIDIAKAAVWLLSDDAAYVTGSTLTADGGVNALSVLPA